MAVESEQDALKQRVAEYAAGLVQDGMKVGLGHGTTSTLMVRTLAKRAQEGLRFLGVPASEMIGKLATSLGLRIAGIDEEPDLDMAIDGADEVDPRLQLIKGGGGALLREKIVASAARQFVVIVDQSKLVPLLGTKWPVPVEVVPFGWVRTQRALHDLGADAVRRRSGADPYLTDGGHFILDCRFAPIADPAALAGAIKTITGVVEHGLFVDMASMVIVGTPEGIEVLRK